MARKGLYLGGSALLLAVVLLLVFWGRPADAEIQVLKAPRAVVWKDFLGVNAQFLWFSPERYNKQIDRLQDLGLEWVRLDLHWDRLETAEDQYQLASLDQLVKDLEARQLKSVFYLVGSARFITTAPFYSPFQDQYPPRDPEVFARRMAMLSQRYPSVAAWQVWNEPNLIGFWRPKADPEGYAKLLQASTIALRMVDPEKPVVSAGMAFFSEMPDGRTMFDALGHLGVESLGTIATYHPYTQLPEGNYPWNLDFVSHANQINRALRNAGVPAIWSTEWGWSAYKGPKELQDIIGVEGQADYVLRRLALMSALDYDRIFPSPSAISTSAPACATATTACSTWTPTPSRSTWPCNAFSRSPGRSCARPTRRSPRTCPTVPSASAGPARTVATSGCSGRPAAATCACRSSRRPPCTIRSAARSRP